LNESKPEAQAACESLEARSLYFEEPGVVALRKEKLDPSPGSTLVTSQPIGISHGTESLFYRGPFPTGHFEEANAKIGESTMPGEGYPIKYGYMNVGTTQEGERVFAFAPHQDRFDAPREELLPIPDSVAFADAVLYPSVETALQITHDAGPRYGELVAICGLGVIGLTLVYLMREMGMQVVGIDPVPTRRERAKEFGATTIDPRAKAAPHATEGHQIDIGINVSSSSQALQFLIDNAAMEGTIVEASWYGEKRTELALGAAFHRRRLSIRASQVAHINPRMRPRWNRARRTELVWQIIERLRPSRFITHRIPLDSAPPAYELIASGHEDLLQAVLIP